MKRLILLFLLLCLASLTIALIRCAPLDAPYYGNTHMGSFLDVVNGLMGRNTLGNARASAPTTPQSPYDQFQSSTGNALPTNPFTGTSVPYNQATTNSFQNIGNNGPAPYSTDYLNSIGYPGSGSTAGTGGTGTPAIDPSLQSNVLGTIQNIQSAYDSLNGGVDSMINDRVNQYNTQYGQQRSNLQNAYGQAADQMAGAYGARGLGDSSFYGNAQQQAGNTYNQNLGDINTNQQQVLGQLGQYGDTTKAGNTAAQGQYATLAGQVPQYDNTQLQSLLPQLQSTYSNLQGQQAGLGTNSQFLTDLGKIAPQANQGASQLAGQLKTLVTSGAPQFAKNQIAQGLIKSAQLTDPNAQGYWQQYYQQLLNGS